MPASTENTAFIETTISNRQNTCAAYQIHVFAILDRVYIMCVRYTSVFLPHIIPAINPGPKIYYVCALYVLYQLYATIYCVHITSSSINLAQSTYPDYSSQLSTPKNA